MSIYIVAVIVSLTLIAILFFALRSTVKRIDNNTKKFFIDKLQDYDYLIEEKKKILNELNKKIEEKKKILSENREEENNKTNVKPYKYYNNRLPKYIDDKLFSKYKDIKNKFSFDKENLIKKFINDNLKSSEKKYKFLMNLRKKFTNEIIYEIIKLKSKDQIQYLRNFITEEELNLTKDLINFNKFKINDYIIKLDVLIEKNDPIIYIYTGEKNVNYNYISPKIETIFDKSINEGIKISYKGILYDYSL